MENPDEDDSIKAMIRKMELEMQRVFLDHCLIGISGFTVGKTLETNETFTEEMKKLLAKAKANIQGHTSSEASGHTSTSSTQTLDTASAVVPPPTLAETLSQVSAIVSPRRLAEAWSQTLAKFPSQMFTKASTEITETLTEASLREETSAETPMEVPPRPATPMVTPASTAALPNSWISEVPWSPIKAEPQSLESEVQPSTSAVSRPATPIVRESSSSLMPQFSMPPTRGVRSAPIQARANNTSFLSREQFLENEAYERAQARPRSVAFLRMMRSIDEGEQPPVHPFTPVRRPQGDIWMDGNMYIATISWSDPGRGDAAVYLVELEVNGVLWKTNSVYGRNRTDFKDVPAGVTLCVRYRVETNSGISEPSPTLELHIGQYKVGIESLRDFHNEYKTIVGKLGSGTYGTVIHVKDSQGQSFAAKKINITLKKNLDSAMREYEVLNRLTHEKIVSLYGAYESATKFILVTEYISGGELFDRIVDEEYMTEADCVQYARQICEAVAYIHSNHIVHLDLKSENIMCVDKHSNNLKIIDFGLARIMETNKTYRSFYGTRDYVAPEILKNEPIGFYTDMWSIGVIMYLLLSGLLPFEGDSWFEQSMKIININYSFDAEPFRIITEEAKDFIENLLMKSSSRMTAAESLNHPWLCVHTPKSRESMAKTQFNLKKYLTTSRNKWQILFACFKCR